ncbi:transposase [Streptomyces sp. G5(2025)]|uniref:transposase n=1 Tax=Streptomyces sp. G5(2025) TaxID=3406628 RepID=UPI003C260EBA
MYATDFLPAEGIRAELDRGILTNFATSSLDQLVTAMKRGLEQLRYRPDLIDDCLAGNALTRPPP